MTTTTLVLIIIGLLLIVFAFLVWRQPSVVRVARSRDMAAPPAVVFSFLQDFKEWRAWSPWEEIDPGMQRDYSEPSSGVGASYHWAGKGMVGEGRMTIEADEPHHRFQVRLEFIKPFKSQATACFELEARDGGSRVTWNYEGKNHPVGRVMGVFMSMDRMMGDAFAMGLEKLDAVSGEQTKKQTEGVTNV